MEQERDFDTNCNWHAQNNPKGLVKGLKDLEIREQVETIHLDQVETSRDQ